MADITQSFVGRDFSAEFERLIALLRTELPEYTDLNHSDAGIVILRLLARETDQLNNYIDRVFNEGFLATAQFRQSLVDLGRLVDYLPTLMSAASTRLRLTRRDDVVGAINIPKFTPFTRPDGLPYLTVEDVQIAADESSVDVNAIQGEVVALVIQPTQFIYSDWSGQPRFDLGSGVIGGRVVIDGWTEVDSFWRSWHTDQHFLLELNGDTDGVWLVMGDGEAGALPPSSNLNVQFVKTVGAQGNCGSAIITGVPSGLSDQITCSNIEIATGGAASEGRDSIRRMIPRVVRTQRRAVIKSDYEALLEHFPGVLHVQCLDRNNSTDWPHDHVALYVVPDGGGPMTSLLKTQIWAECAAWGELGPWKERYILRDATMVPVDVTLKIGVAQGYTFEGVSVAVRTAISNLLNSTTQSIGGSMSFAQLYQAVQAVLGVQWVQFASPTQDAVAPTGAILVPGAITITP